jgi:hypothetical protein
MDEPTQRNVKVAELEGRELDHWVCRAEGWRKHVWPNGEFDWRLAPTDDDEIGALVADENFRPSTDWAHGGPIIERECICLQPAPRGLPGEWVAKNDPWCEDWEYLSNGPLVAAMRCYVASKFREEFEPGEAK